MVSVIKEVVRREEAGIWMRRRIEEGYWKGSWEHIKQSDKVLIKAWRVPKGKDA
jgi:ribosomal protein L37AE/L43A